MQITSLAPQKNHKSRFNLFVDDKFLLGIPLEIVVRENLKVGQELSEKEINFLKKESLKGLLLEKSLRLLSLRPLSEKELRSKLQKSGKIEKNILDEVVIVLKVKNLINDEDFANWWYQERKRVRPRSIAIIRGELLQKGISREIVDKIINASSSFDQDKELALTLSQKKIKSYARLGFFDKKKSLARFLAGKGFSWDTVSEVIDAVLPKE